MSDLLLSIVVPTKNRYEYLKAFIDLYSTFDKDKTELVIQDNSDTKTDIEQYTKNFPEKNIIYNYVPKAMPVIENSELAILNSRGKYVCFMGDDDLLSKYVVDIVEKMDRSNIDSIVFKKAIYSWPGMQYKAHNFPSLNIPNFTGEIRHIDSKREYEKLLQRGATELDKIPQLYHGIVKRSVLNAIKDTTGSFFPGPSPDMAVATCLSRFVSHHVYIDAPFVSSGKSPKSAAGLGAKHEHKGELKAISFLPSDIEEKWDKRLPFVWTGPTIYAQSALEAMKSMGLKNDQQRFDFSYFYAYFDTFCSDYKKQSQEAKKNVSLNHIRYWFSRVGIFSNRIKVYIKNKMLLSLHWGGKLVENVPNCIEAERIIDEEIEKVLNIEMIDLR